ncbi:TraR/DksA family transcriptional regulator [Streptomyces sp. NPDC015242]|uniref:TraR/DksA family transcriptional regulator n=1 Tax=Streptomyces sp. NPDC015242 TaxID=3364951 RepID=UPI0036F50C6E
MPAKKAASKKAVTGQAAGQAAADGGDAQAAGAAGKKAGAKKAAAGKDPAEAAVVEGEAVGGKRKAERAGAVKKGAEGVAGQGAGGTSTTSKSAAGPGAARTGAVTQDTAGSSTAKKAGAAEAAPQTGATTVGAKKTPGTATAAKTAVPKARAGVVEPGELAVRPGEDPWTAEEVEEARSELMSEEARLREEISSSERSLAGLMRDSGDGAGHDEADTGSKNITREHELALAANAREMLDQTERALDRLDSGTYGLCENCGNPIGKARMQAFPRATLCVECKQKQERRY